MTEERTKNASDRCRFSKIVGVACGETASAWLPNHTGVIVEDPVR